MSSHDCLVRSAALVFSIRGFSVEADLKGWKRPRTSRKFRPDITGVNGEGKRVVAEIEEAHTLFSSHTRRQLRQLGRMAQRRNTVAYLIVPQPAKLRARLRVGQLGLHREIRVASITPMGRATNG